jgi:cell division protein ZipA
MSSLFFYLIFILVIIAISWLFFYQRKHAKKRLANIKREPMIDFNSISPVVSISDKQSESAGRKKSAYDPSVIVLQIQAFPGKPYMGYELLQTLLSLEMRFGEMNIFHRHESEYGKDTVLFSIAAATPEGTFPIDNMGSFKCPGLVVFMKFATRQKLMRRFDLMLDVARQLVEELGGEIYDDLYQPINVAAIKRLREKICAVETNNHYTADLFDNLD